MWKLLACTSVLFTRGKQSKGKDAVGARSLSSSSGTVSHKPGGYERLQMELEWLTRNFSSSDARELSKLFDHDHS
jgi:hypothetical protein